MEEKDLNPVEEFLDKKTRLYSSVIPGVMDSTELEDMRKLLALVRVYREANYQIQKEYGDKSAGLKARAAEEKAQEIVKG